MWTQIILKYWGVSLVQKGRVLVTIYFGFVILVDKCLWQTFLCVNQCFVWTWLVESLPWNKMGANPAGTCGDPLVWLLCSKQDQLQQAAHSHVHLGSWNSSKDGDSTICHGGTVLDLTPFTVERVFHIFKWNFPYFNLCLLLLSCFHWAPLRSICSIFFIL